MTSFIRGVLTTSIFSIRGGDNVPPLSNKNKYFSGLVRYLLVVVVHNSTQGYP